MGIIKTPEIPAELLEKYRLKDQGFANKRHVWSTRGVTESEACYRISWEEYKGTYSFVVDVIYPHGTWEFVDGPFTNIDEAVACLPQPPSEESDGD